MFKKTFLGYKLKSVNEAIKIYNNKIETEVEKQEKAIETVLEKQEQLTEELKRLNYKVDDACFNTLMIEKLNKYMPNVIDEARRYTKEMCQELIHETESFSNEIDEQIIILDENIEIIKERLQTLVQGTSDITKLVNCNQLDEEDQKDKLNERINSFKNRVETPNELGIPMEKLSLKEKSGNLMQELFQLEKEEKNLILHEEEITKEEKNKESIPLDQVAITNDIKSNFTEATILVAEDDKDTADFLQHLLEREGFKVINASDGNEVSKLINEIIPPQLVVFNMMLPEVDSLELIKLIRNMPDWEYVPIIVLTENDIDRDTADVLNAGGDDCIKKPFDGKEIVARIRRFLS